MQDPAISNLVRTGVLVLYCLQLLYLLYPIRPQIPTQADFTAGQALVQDIKRQVGCSLYPVRQLPGVVCREETLRGYRRTGRSEPGACRRRADRAWNSINSQLRTLIKNRDFSLIILDENADWGSAEHYFQPTYKASRISYLQDAFFPVAGWRIRPFTLYTPLLR